MVRAGKWRFSREAAAKRPPGLLQRAGAACRQRVRATSVELRPYPYANYRRCKLSHQPINKNKNQTKQKYKENLMTLQKQV